MIKLVKNSPWIIQYIYICRYYNTNSKNNVASPLRLTKVSHLPEGERQVHKTVYDMKIQLHRWLGVAVAWLGITSANAYDLEMDGIYYDINSDETSVTVTNETGDSYAGSYSGDVVIPSSVTHDGKNYSVTTIGDCAFRGCTSLTSIAIPESVRFIEDQTFYGCSKLTSVTIPGSVTNIGEGAFSYCNSLQLFVVAEDNIAYTSLDGVLFDKEMTTLIQFPGGREGAYTIPEGVKTIGGQAFIVAVGLTSITIPESVTTIEGSAFFGCYGLTEVIIPNSVTTIGDYAFQYCDLLETIKSYAEVPPVIGAYTFSNYNATLHVPVDCGEAYREAEYWANFTNIVESIDSRVEALQDEKTRVYMVGNTLHVENGGNVYQVYTLTGQPVYTGDDTTMQLDCPGIYIVCTGKRSQKVIVR